MKKYDHSFHAYIQGIILIGFALLILGLIMTGNIVYYIAPSMMPFIYFALGTFFLLGIMQVFRSTKKDSHQDSCSCEADHQIKGPFPVKLLIYSIFILPILFGFILPDRALDSSVAANRGIQYGSGLGINQVSGEGESSLSRAEAYLDDPEGYINSLSENNGETDDIEHFQLEDFYDQDWYDDYYSELADEFAVEDTITVTEQNYLDVMTVLDIYLDRFIGKEIEILGFAYREEDFEDHQIVIARFSMTCCTADAGVYGTLVESQEAKDFEEDTWLFARGTIKKGQYNDFIIPIIEDAYLVEVEQPATPYVYPNFNR
ncbi:TIGR03943 family putative permease subunit [Evansella tamaricis]|uniref:TIGR03943 family protein n=1 Tax=Evansella tamaricis TaxID=2069301 RepID=A0ABS6JM50_9BACI|nr:TIGR03943 family protein [Evansella tamaricis]MBU9714748.1 TIGR03943 family protein [Evansella tamaricis]